MDISIRCYIYIYNSGFGWVSPRSAANLAGLATTTRGPAISLERCVAAFTLVLYSHRAGLYHLCLGYLLLFKETLGLAAAAHFDSVWPGAGSSSPSISSWAQRISSPWILLLVILVAANITPSKRRSARRKRAIARFRWHLHRTGLRILTAEQLRALATTLSKHHSRDPGLLRRILAAMASQQQDNSGWMCGNCKKLRAKNAWFCDLCGSAWEDCIVYPRPKTQQSRSASRRTYWTAPDQSPWEDHYGDKSPRQQPKKNRGRGKGKPKGRNGPQQQTLAPPPPPPIGPQGHQPPWMSMPLPPGAASSSASTTLTPAEQKLREVSTMLKKANLETLTPELQQFVAEETKAASKKDAKTLYTAVDTLTKAREELDTALLARSNLMTQWRSFLTMSLERFRQYTDHFQNQEQAHQENIKNAKEKLHQAKEDFSSKEEAATVISDDEGEAKDASTKESATKILEGLAHMTESLQKLSEQAEKEEEEERKAKRPRQKEGAPPDVVMPSGGLQSMQPFGVPGHWWLLSTLIDGHHGLLPQLLLMSQVYSGRTQSSRSPSTSHPGRPVKTQCTLLSSCSRTALQSSASAETGVSLSRPREIEGAGRSHSTHLHMSILDQNSVPHGLPAEFLLLRFHNEIGWRSAALSRNPIAMAAMIIGHRTHLLLRRVLRPECTDQTWRKIQIYQIRPVHLKVLMIGSDEPLSDTFQHGWRLCGTFYKMKEQQSC